MSNKQNEYYTTIFDGNSLKIRLTIKLFKKITKITNTKELNLYNRNKKMIIISQQTICKNNVDVYLPIGIYSNSEMNLNCIRKDSNRTFFHKLSSVNNINIRLSKFQVNFLDQVYSEINIISKKIYLVILL